MPYYQWKCDKCKLEVDILRHFSEYLDIPTAEEIAEVPSAEKETGEGNCSHKWERTVQVPAAYKIWPGSGGKGKGNW